MPFQTSRTPSTLTNVLLTLVLIVWNIALCLLLVLSVASVVIQNGTNITQSKVYFTLCVVILILNCIYLWLDDITKIRENQPETKATMQTLQCAIQETDMEHAKIGKNVGETHNDYIIILNPAL